MINQISRWTTVTFKIVIAVLFVGIIGSFQHSARAASDPIVYNGAVAKQATSTYQDSDLTGNYKQLVGLERAAYISINGEKSNYSGNGVASIIDIDQYIAAGKPTIYAHIYLRNNRGEGGGEINAAQILRHPKDMKSSVVMNVDDSNPIISGNKPGENHGVKKEKFFPNHVVAKVTLAPGEWVDFSVPMTVDDLNAVDYEAGQAFTIKENNWGAIGTQLGVRFAKKYDLEKMQAFQPGQYLVTTRDQDGYYQQEKAIQSLMPTFNRQNDITFSNLGGGFGANEPALYTRGSFFVDGNQMTAQNGQPFMEMLYTHGYAPVWASDRNSLLTHESFTTVASNSGGGSSQPGYFDSLLPVLNHNGIGGINFHVQRVIDAADTTVKQGEHWQPLAHVKIWNPLQDRLKDLVEEPDVTVSTENGRLNADGTLDTNTPGVYDVKYRYVATYPNNEVHTLTKTIKVTVPGRSSGGGSTGGGSTTNVTPTENSNAGQSKDDHTPSPSESQTTEPSKVADSNGVAKKGAAVYGLKKIYLYRNATFNKRQRLAVYPKTKRIERPMFVVTDYAHSKNGILRYRVKDVNHKSKTAGKVGYITANRHFVTKVYYGSLPSSKRITVIATKGVNAYRNKNLTKRVTHYKKGRHLQVKKIVTHNLTTRYQLTNGNYVTGNKKLIIQDND